MKSYNVCYYCVRPIYSGGIAWRDGRTRFLNGGFEKDIHHAHKGCMRKHLPRGNFIDRVFKRVDRGLEVKADFIKQIIKI